MAGGESSGQITAGGHVTLPDVCVSSSKKLYALPAGALLNVKMLFVFIVLIK